MHSSLFNNNSSLSLPGECHLSFKKQFKCRLLWEALLDSHGQIWPFLHPYATYLTIVYLSILDSVSPPSRAPPEQGSSLMCCCVPGPRYRAWHRVSSKNVGWVSSDSCGLPYPPANSGPRWQMLSS